MRSFADPDTFYHIVVSHTSISVDGFALGEPTGEIECLECGASHSNVDEIPHEKHCSQRFVHSEWYVNSMLAE